MECLDIPFNKEGLVFIISLPLALPSSIDSYVVRVENMRSRILPPTASIPLRNSGSGSGPGSTEKSKTDLELN